jgi:hypothetical protein
MLNERDLIVLLRMVREARELEAADRISTVRWWAVGIAAVGVLAASVSWLWLLRPTTSPAPRSAAVTAPASVQPEPAVARMDAEPRKAEQGRVVLAVIHDGEEVQRCVVHKDFGGVQGHALALLSRADLAQLAGHCGPGPLRVLLIELAGPARLLPANPVDAQMLIDCLDLAEERMGDLGCAAAACVPAEVSVTTARVALASWQPVENR